MRADQSETDGWTLAEKAYSAWVGAAREKAGGAVALVRMLGRHLQKAGMLEQVSAVSALWASNLASERDQKGARAKIARWEKGSGSSTKRPQYPAEEPLREALVETVTALVPSPPEEMAWVTFAEVCKVLDDERLKAQGRGGRAEQDRAVRERNERRHQFLAVWPAAAQDLDPIALGLGSWAFGGALPPYVPRAADTDLAARLRAPGPGITVVAGAPKSGKSRSILQTLQHHHPGALIWWVNPSPTVLPLVVQAAKEAGRKDARPQEKPVFVVLDDAALIGADPASGLTAQRLTDLAAACTHLLVVIHDQALADWEYRLTHHGPEGADTPVIGATRELVELLRHQVHYQSKLQHPGEMSGAAVAYEGADPRIKSFDMARLAETLAGVEMLHAKTHRLLKTPNSVEAALVEAVIDASIAFPAGTSEAILSFLAHDHHRHRQPNQPWRPDKFDDALDTLTTGITIGSPHAILTTTQHNRYRLLDALTPELQRSDHDTLRAIRMLRKGHDESGQVTYSDLEEALWNTGLWHDTNHQKDKATEIWTDESAWDSIMASYGLEFILGKAAEKGRRRREQY